MKEVTIEEYAVEQAKKRGGDAVKWGQQGWLDRLVVIPYAVGALELKRPGKGPTVLQAARLRYLGELEIVSGWADSFEGVDSFFKLLDERAALTRRALLQRELMLEGL